MINELDRIPKEIYEEAEKYGVLRDSIEIATMADRARDGNFMENWILFTKDEILFIGGIHVVEPKSNVRRVDPNKLTVRFDKITVEHMDRAPLSKYKVEKQISGCILTAYNSDTNSYSLITYTTRDKELQFCELCEILNEGDADAKKAVPEVPSADSEQFGRPSHGGPGHGGHGPGGPEGARRGGPDRKRSRDEEYCPKCGRKYPNPETGICPHCVSKFSVLKCLWGFTKKYKFSVGLIFLAMALMSALTVISPYISSQFFYDEVLTEGGKFFGQVLLVIGIMLAMKVLSLIMQMISDVITARVVPKITCDLKKTIFDSIEKLSLSFFTNRKTGSLMTQVNGDANTIYWFFVDGLPYLIINIAQVIAVGVIMFCMDWRLTIVALALCPLAFFLSTRLFATMKKLHARSFSASRSMSGQLSDMLGAVRVVKAFAGEKNEVREFNKRSEAAAQADRNVGVFSGTMFPAVTFLFTIGSVLLLGVGGWFVMKGELTYGQLLAFTAYSGMMTSPIMFFVNIVESISNCFNATYRLMEVMDAKPEVTESENPVRLESLKGEVEFRNVCFGYDKTRKVIDDVSFKISPGGKVGIVGHTGAGKSTLANLLIRLYDCDTGEILIDGKNVRDLSFETIRQNVSIVSQETYLFIGSILENIRYARPDATPEEIITASKISGAHEFIMKLPDGYETILGTGNRQLSGGERQRISIARAILRNPRILILDEATSAMDTRTERAIQATLEKLCEGRTTIMIAHRLSTLRDCEALLVIENGKVAEHGSHMELIKQKGLYFRLYSLQYEALKDAGVEE